MDKEKPQKNRKPLTSAIPTLPDFEILAVSGKRVALNSWIDKGHL
jgi:hypothetical protein